MKANNVATFINKQLRKETRFLSEVLKIKVFSFAVVHSDTPLQMRPKIYDGPNQEEGMGL